MERKVQPATTSPEPLFQGRLAVVTGAGTGMGRELAVQLAAGGCDVAICDLNPVSVERTAEQARSEGHSGVKVTTHTCDVADEGQVLSFRDEVVAQHGVSERTTPDPTNSERGVSGPVPRSVSLVFNNAGIHGTGSFVTGSRREWDRVFAVCWGGVYHCSRAFVPLLVNSDRGWLVNTSSVNGLWASHSAYSAAKFAVRGFSEALLKDFRVSAPHVRVALVFPGYVGTDIVHNSRAILAAEEVSESDRAAFRDNAPLSADLAARIILEDVRAGKWRILVGHDARVLDERVRADPLAVYEPGSRRPGGAS